MSSRSPEKKKKKVVVSTSKSTGKKKARVRRPGRQLPPSEVLLYHRKHFIIMGIGVLLIVLGLVLMAGGGAQDYDTWNPDKIYSFRRTVLAPGLMIAGFIVQIYMIFKK